MDLPDPNTLVLLGQIPYLVCTTQLTLNMKVVFTKQFMEDIKDDPRIIGQRNDAARIGWYGGKEGDHGTGRLHSFRASHYYNNDGSNQDSRRHTPTSDTTGKFF